MKLLVDTSDVTFTATKATEERRDQNGEVKHDRRSGAVLFTTQVMALDSNGGKRSTSNYGARGIFWGDSSRATWMRLGLIFTRRCLNAR